LIPYEMINSYTNWATAEATDPKGIKPSATVYVVKYSCGFKGGLPITREEMAAVAMNCLSYAANAKGKELTRNAQGIHDSDISEAYLGAVNDAYACGLVKGVEGSTFRPKDNLTRAQAVTIINRIAAIMKGNGEV
ncbi:MAG: S-layer homology domain-containing protein, partial [Clostridia bacterium]|nr:S-layer homology domain-containing protein [Clostridia bacterium]